MNPRAKTPPKEPALPYAVKLLSTRAYSVKKLRDKLYNRGYHRDEIEEALGKLSAKNLIDDERYAEGFLRTRLEIRPRGKTALVRDLLSRGVDLSTAKHAVDHAVGKEDELKLALELLRRKARQYSDLDDDTRKRRLVALLARRGFKPDTIHKALDLSDSEMTEE